MAVPLEVAQAPEGLARVAALVSVEGGRTVADTLGAAERLPGAVPDAVTPSGERPSPLVEKLLAMTYGGVAALATLATGDANDALLAARRIFTVRIRTAPLAVLIVKLGPADAPFPSSTAGHLSPAASTTRIAYGVASPKPRARMAVITEVLPDAMVAIARPEKRPIQVLQLTTVEVRLPVGLAWRAKLLGTDEVPRPTALAADVETLPVTPTTRHRLRARNAPKAVAIPTSKIARLPRARVLPTASRQGKPAVIILAFGWP